MENDGSTTYRRVQACLVSTLTGGQGVVGSNPAIPTILLNRFKSLILGVTGFYLPSIRRTVPCHWI